MSGISNVSQSNQTVILNGSSLQVQPNQVEPLNLKNGSIIQGTVVSVNDTVDGKIVNLNVSGNEISAKLRDDMNLMEGQTLNFAVKGLNSKAVSITPLYENTAILQSTIKALTAAGLENSPENVHMVKEMMEAGLPIDKNSLLEMSKNADLYPDSPVSSLIEMKSLNIPITEKNVISYENYKNYEHQVVNDIETITNELPTAFNALIENGEEAKAMILYGSVLKLFGQEHGKEASQLQENVDLQNPESKLQGEQINEKIVFSDESFNPDLQLKTSGDISKPIEQFALNTKNPEALLQKDSSIQQTFKGVSGDFIDNLRNLNISETTIEKFVQSFKSGSNEAVQKELLQELAQNYERSDLSNIVENAAWKKLFMSDEYNKLLKDNISEQWLLKPNDVSEKANVENLYQRLGTQVKHLAETINNTLGAESKLGQSANNLSNNLDFMNQINQMFQYVQLPLLMTGQNVHGDLYVYRNKHKKMSEDGSVSAVLHLDMDNLGPVDVYVKMIEKKVTTNFYVADDSVLDLINDNIHVLNERLEKRGYSMKVTMKLHDELDGDNAAVDEMFDVARAPMLSTASFDARA